MTAMYRLLFIGLWTQADREGRLEDRPKRIKAELFPYDNIDIDKGLNELQAKGFIVRYKGNANVSDRILSPEQPANEVNCIQILTFTKHQKIDRINENLSQLPEYQGENTLVENKSFNSLVKAGEGKGKERKGKEGDLPQAAENDPEFSDEQNELFRKFQGWMLKNTPTVVKMEKPLTIKEFFVLRGTIPNSNGKIVSITKQECQDILLSIENNKNYLKKFRSPYLCILAWHKRNT